MKYPLIMKLRNFFLTSQSKRKLQYWAEVLNQNHPDCKDDWKGEHGELFYEIQLKRFYSLFLQEFVNTKFSNYELKVLAYGWKNPTLINIYKKKHNIK